jgi:hypothetical protein
MLTAWSAATVPEDWAIWEAWGIRIVARLQSERPDLEFVGDWREEIPEGAV